MDRLETVFPRRQPYLIKNQGMAPFTLPLMLTVEIQSLYIT